MPLFDGGRPLVSSVEPWWGPVARAFDKERRGKPKKRTEDDEGGDLGFKRPEDERKRADK